MLYLELFRKLDDAGVRYLVVGGIAVNLHGVNRLTHDIDLMLALDAVKKDRDDIAMLQRLGELDGTRE